MSGIHKTELVITCLSVTFLKRHHPKEEWAFSQCGLQVLKEPGNVFKKGAGVLLFSTSTSKLLVHAASSIYSLNESEEPHNEISQLLHLRHTFVCMHIKILQRLIYIYSALVLTERVCFIFCSD